MSPDGRNVYVASGKSAAVEVSTRGADGRLTPAGCLGDARVGPGNCTGVADLDPAELAVSPDGRNIYVVGDNTLNVLSRAANGTIAAMGCIEDFTTTRAQGEPHCGQTANLLEVAAVAVSPDGNDVYVGSVGDDSIEVFGRGPGGMLTAMECIGDSEDGPANCVKVPGLGPVFSLAVSPDGKNLYAGAENSLSTLDRDANGAIHADDCVRDVGDGPVSCSTQANLKQVEALAISPNGKTLYAVAPLTDDVEVFARGPGGNLTELGCVGNAGSGPKNCTGVAGLNEPLDVVTSNDPGGSSVYVSAAAGLQVFTAGANGTLTSSGCVVSDSASSSSCATAPGLGRFALGIAVSPDANTHNLYLTTEAPGSVLEFTRSPAVTTSTTTTTTTSATTTTTGGGKGTSTTTRPTTTSAKKPAKTAKPAVAARLTFATVLRNKQGKLTLQVGLHVSKSVSARIRLLGAHSAVLATATVTLTIGSHTISLPLRPSITPGLRQIVAVLTDASNNHTTLSTGVVVPH